MSTTDLPDLYARVVAKRPELMPWREHLDFKSGLYLHAREGLFYWGWKTENGYGGMWPPEPDAAALILARWVEALPVGACMHHMEVLWGPPAWGVAGGPGWQVLSNRLTSPTPLEALAVYYLGDSQ